MYGLARPFLFGLDPERAHALGLAALESAYRCGLNPLLAARPQPLPTKVLGLAFPNPVGLAAGLDKNGAHIDALLSLGFGFVEVGTVTPKPQPGNPKPRMFRLPQHRAIINRLGFNNDGVDALVRNVERAQRKGGLLGINIGKNKDTPNESAESDYLLCMERVYPLADYITVNISSPNTAGLRELQEEQALRRLVSILREAQERLGAQHGKRVPMLVKVAPDLSDDDIDAAGRVLADLHVDGVVATNTADRGAGAPDGPLNRRPVRRAADGQVDRGAAHAAHAPAGSDPADRRRRHHDRRRCGQEDGRGRLAGAAVHRADLPRSGAGRRVRRRDAPAQGSPQSRQPAAA